MTRKKINAIYCMAALGLVFAGTSLKFSYSATNANELMLANVEALADDADEGKEKKSCGTKEEHMVAKLVCPKTSCKAKVGFTGVIYSYMKKGDKETYLDGRVGTNVVCSPYHGMVEDINNVQILSCK